MALDDFTQKRGAQQLVALIQDFYTGKEAKVSVEGVLSAGIALNTGLGQGCCLAPTLFNVYLAAVVEAWMAKTPACLRWRYRLDGVLRRHMDAATLAKYTS